MIDLMLQYATTLTANSQYISNMYITTILLLFVSAVWRFMSMFVYLLFYFFIKCYTLPMSKMYCRQRTAMPRRNLFRHRIYTWMWTSVLEIYPFTKYKCNINAYFVILSRNLTQCTVDYYPQKSC